MSTIFFAIMFFMFGATVGAMMGLFIASVGKNNQEHEYYHEGFIDGYAKAKEEIK